MALYIIRGLPGSGKSTLAKQMLDCGMVKLHVEADLFMVDKDGNYKFEARKLGECHEKCKNLVEWGLKNNLSVVVSNTFVKRWEMSAYFQLADFYKVRVFVMICQGSFANVHGVPAAKVLEMQRKFEL